MWNSVLLAARCGAPCVPAPFGSAPAVSSAASSPGRPAGLQGGHVIERSLDRSVRRQPSYVNNRGRDSGMFEARDAMKSSTARFVVRFGTGRYSNRTTAFFAASEARS